MTEEKEKIGVLIKVAPNNGGIVFEDEPDKWYNATNTAKPNVKADLKGKKVVIRLADKPCSFSFISLSADQPEKAPEEENINEEKAPMSKDDYWNRKEARDLLVQEQIARHGALNTALESIKASITSGSSGATQKPEDILKLAETLSDNHILPFVKAKK